MSLMSGFSRFIIVTLLASLLVSCRIFVTPIVSVSELKDSTVRTIPVTLSSDISGCNKPFLDQIASEFHSFHNITPLGCFDDDSKDLKPFWKATIPLLRTGDEGKIPYLSASIYYSMNNSIIITFNPSFFDKLKQFTVGRGVSLPTDVVVTMQIVNDTKEPVRLATQGVFVNNEAVGNEMTIFEIKPGGKVWVKLSNVGVNSLLAEGIEPVGVLPAKKLD